MARPAGSASCVPTHPGPLPIDLGRFRISLQQRISKIRVSFEPLENKKVFANEGAVEMYQVRCVAFTGSYHHCISYPGF